MEDARILPDNNDHYGVELKINGEKQKFIIDTGSQVTIMPYNQNIHDIKEIKPMKERYQDVNKNEIKFIGKTWVNVEYNKISTKLPMLITKRNDITALLAVNWLKQLQITTNKSSLANETNQSEIQTLHYQQHNKTCRSQNTKKCNYPIQQKARPIHYHLQGDVKNELNRLIKSRQMVRLERIEEECFVSPVVITVKKDESVKIALDARKINESCIKKRPHMRNKNELLNQISADKKRHRSNLDIRNRF